MCVLLCVLSEWVGGWAWHVSVCVYVCACVCVAVAVVPFVVGVV